MREREWIRRFVRPLAPRAAEDGTLLGPGDDAALCAVPEGTVAVLTTDTLVDGRHFRNGWLTDAELARRLVAVTVSDLAATGAMPLGLLLSIETSELPGRVGEDFFRGIAAALGRSGPLLGGNVVRTDGPLALTATSLGCVEPARALRRDAARPGDAIFVSGVPGRAAAALGRLERGEDCTFSERAAWVDPPDRVALGRALGAAGVRTAVDVSDGLLLDLASILEESGVGARLELGPLRDRLGGAIDLAGACRGGEDYELLVTGDAASIERAFAELGETPLRLGEIIEGDATELRLDGSPVEVDVAGWDPFAAD